MSRASSRAGASDDRRATKPSHHAPSCRWMTERNQSVEMVWRWRLSAKRPAPLACSHQQSIWPVVQRGHLAFQPARESVSIVLHELAKAEGVADLCAVIYGDPAAPVIASPGFGRHLDLAGNPRDRGDGDLLKPVWDRPLSWNVLSRRRSPAAWRRSCCRATRDPTRAMPSGRQHPLRPASWRSLRPAAIRRACSLALALSMMPGKRRRSSTAADISPPVS